MSTAPHVLVSGAGSAGRRHARNLRALGVRVSVYDPREDRVAEAASEGATEGRFTDFDAALSRGPYDGFMIASPPSVHVQQMLQAFAGSPPNLRVMCEKPLSVDLASCAPLAPFLDRVLLTYTYRFWPPIVELRRRLHAGAIGAARSARFVMSAHLADWHPWEPYQEFFMASRALGGGALLDESHFIDLAHWFFGEMRSVTARIEKVSDLEIDSDDHVDILLTSASGVRVNVHLDLIGRPHERSICVMGDRGTLKYEYENNVLRHGDQADRPWSDTRFTCERNDMFSAAAEEYVRCMSGAAPTTCTARDGVVVLRTLDACRKSHAAGRRVELEALPA